MAEKSKPTNGPEPELIKGFVDRIEALDADILTERGKAAKKVQTIKSNQASVIDEAVSKGVNRRALKAVLKRRALLSKVVALNEEVTDDLDVASQYRLAVEAVGDFSTTPLGATAAKAKAKEASTDLTNVVSMPEAKT